MTWRDKLEIGLKPDAPYRKDNLPDQQVRGPEVPAGKGRSPVVPAGSRRQDGRPRSRSHPPPSHRRRRGVRRLGSDGREQTLKRGRVP